MSEDTGFFRTLAGYATARARHAKDRWLADSPQTYYSSGGTGDYQWQGQAVDRDELKQVKQIRETGGMVAQLYHAKALIRFGTGAELQAEDDDLQAALEDLFPSLDNLVLDLGEDAIWYPYALAEPIETNGSGFSHYECVEPWTTVPRTDEHGDIIAWEHEVNRQEQVFMPDELRHITVNKSSGRDTVGISDVLRSEDEITQYKENQRAINHAIELAGFPHNVWKVGEKGKAPINDNELRRVRNIVEDPAGDTQWVMGADVEVDQIQPGKFDFSSITERDLRMLTGAIGLPFELVGYGSDGLGSGHEAELKMNLLAIQNEADRRRFAEQFVDRFVRPVVERYTPYSGDEEITLHIAPFLDQRDDMAELIDKVGKYMSNAEVRERLDLPPLEDEETAEAFRPPQQIEEAEEGDQTQEGPFGGMFSDAARDAVDSELSTRELADSEAVLRLVTEFLQDYDGGEDSEPNISDVQEWIQGTDRTEEGAAVDFASVVDSFREANPDVDIGEATVQDLLDWMDSRDLEDGGTDFSGLPEWERSYLGMYEHALWSEDTDRALAGFSSSALPEMVQTRLREAILGGAIFSDFDTIPSSELMELRQTFADTLTDDGWTLDEMTDALQDLEPSLSENEAEVIARTETASAVNTAREEAYEDRGLSEADEFYWSSTPDHRRTDACEWLTDETERRNGVTLETLRELIEEAPTHDDDMQDNLARPENYVVHPNERSTYVRKPD